MNNSYYETFRFLKAQRKEAIYNFIKKFISEKKYSPSFSEIAAAVCCSTSTIKPYLYQLKIENKIGYTEKVNRSIFLKEITKNDANIKPCIKNKCAYPQSCCGCNEFFEWEKKQNKIQKED